MSLINKYSGGNINSRPKADYTVKTYTDTATKGVRDSRIEEFDVQIVKPGLSEQKDPFTNYEITDARDKSELPEYLETLKKYGLVDLDDDECNEILSLSYDEAMEYINEAREDMAISRAEYYEEIIGIPVTDEFVEILKLPNAEESKRYNQYMNDHFTEFKSQYIEFQKSNGLEFTDEQNAKINTINTMDEMNEYLAKIYNEASFRYNSTIQAREEYERRCYAKTGYSLDDLLSGKAESDIDAQLNNLYGSYDSFEGSSQDLLSLNNSINDIKSQKEKMAKLRQEFSNLLDERIEFLTQNYLMKSSSKLDDVSLYGNYENTDEFKFYYGGKEVTYYDANTGIVKYTEWSAEKNAYIEVTDNINNLTIYDNWEIYGKFDSTGQMVSSKTMDGHENEFNAIALVKRYLDAKDSTDYRDQLFCYALSHDTTGCGELFNGSYGASLFDLVSTMSEDEIKIYNMKYEDGGYIEAEKYLESLASGLDFQDRLATELAIKSIEHFADVKPVDYNELEEISVEKMQEMYDEAQNSGKAFNVITDIGSDGNVHYYAGKEKVMYISKLENGREVYYEASAVNWPSAMGYSVISCNELFDGITGFFGDASKLFAESDAEYTVSEKTKALVSQAYSLYEHGQTVAGVAGGVGRAVPTMVISLIPGGGYVAVAANWMSHVGGKKDQTVKQGYTVEEAWKYAAISGTVDTAVDVFTRNIPGLNKAIGHADKYFVTSVLKSGLGAAGNYTQDLLIRDWVLGESFSENFDWSQMNRQAINSMLVTGLLNSYKIPNDIEAARNIMQTSGNLLGFGSEVKTLMDEQGLSKKDAKRVYRLQKFKGLSQEEAINAASLMNEEIDGKHVSQKDAISLISFKKTLQLDDDTILSIYKISRETELSLEESTLVNKIKNDNNIDLNEAVQVYNNMLSLGLDQTDAVKIVAVQKLGLDIDYDKLSDSGYIRDLLAMGDLAVSRDINSLKAMKASGKITQADVDNFFNLFNDSLLGDEFLSWIKNSDVGFVLYADLMNSTERAGLSMDAVTKNIDLLSSMMAYYTDARDNLNKPTNLKSFTDAYVFNKQADHFDSYRTHGIVHVLDVYNKSMETYAEFKNAGVTGLDHETIAIAAMMHDTGMSGKFEMVSDISVGADGTISDGTGKIVWKDMARTSENDILSVGRWRGQHSANSGRIILENADTLREFGYSDLQIAEASLLAFVHSKSNSGVRSLTNNDNGWSFAINALAESNKDFDFLGVLKDNGLITGVNGSNEIQIGKTGKPDTYKFKYDEFTFNNEWIEKMAYEGLIVRIGDALTNNDNGLTNQYGDIIHINYDNYSEQRSIASSLAECDITSVDKNIFDSLEDLAAKESEKIKYKIGDGSKAKEMKSSQKYVLGEDNQTYSIRTNPKTGGIEVVVSIKKANDLPFCTLYALNERLGELDTRGTEIFKASSDRNLSLVIEFDETPNDDVRNVYGLFRDNMSSVTPIIINYPNS